MKRFFCVFLASALLLAGCAKPAADSIKADQVSVFYGVSSYALFSEDQKVIRELIDSYNGLSFEKTEAELDFISAFSVILSYEGKNVIKFTVDKYGVFWLDGDTQCYKVASGSFDYARLKSIYEDTEAQP